HRNPQMHTHSHKHKHTYTRKHTLSQTCTHTLCSYSDFKAYTRAKKYKTYICKPDSGCQGRGIFLTKSSKDIKPGEHMICQVYISRVRRHFSCRHFDAAVLLTYACTSTF